jgi:hypothetical protein
MSRLAKCKETRFSEQIGLFSEAIIQQNDKKLDL